MACLCGSIPDQRSRHHPIYVTVPSEGFLGEAKTWHGLARAVRRSLDNMRIQSCLTAGAINLRRLAAAVLAVMLRIIDRSRLSRRDTGPSQLEIARYAVATQCTV